MRQFRMTIYVLSAAFVCVYIPMYGSMWDPPQGWIFNFSNNRLWNAECALDFANWGPFIIIINFGEYYGTLILTLMEGGVDPVARQVYQYVRLSLCCWRLFGSVSAELFNPMRHTKTQIYCEIRAGEKGQIK